jgi:hypothetical protein
MCHVSYALWQCGAYSLLWAFAEKGKGMAHSPAPAPMGGIMRLLPGIAQEHECNCCADDEKAYDQSNLRYPRRRTLSPILPFTIQWRQSGHQPALSTGSG